ncbi:uncharacterized protein LOC116124329 [Pistacia vera]|uniref:uncharacterized protein LOC116124329 n=1 Tax=Pistacia vera TaxID=55513 RepID=UPI00126302D6|nr:uncharacterized protein LOC116124329 [Pistacia vera]XP_031265922.1 uncharacterized protein LOC116124329 [Pistacia vera]
MRIEKFNTVDFPNSSVHLAAISNSGNSSGISSNSGNSGNGNSGNTFVPASAVTTMPISQPYQTYSSHYIPPSGFAGSPGHFRPTSYSGQFESQVHTYRPSGFNNYNKGRGRGNAKGRPICQVCSKIGHTAVQCYHRYNSNYNGAPPQFGSPPQFESSGFFNSGNLGNFLPTHNSVGYGSRFGSGNFGNQQLHNFTAGNSYTGN